MVETILYALKPNTPMKTTHRTIRIILTGFFKNFAVLYIKNLSYYTAKLPKRKAPIYS